MIYILRIKEDGWGTEVKIFENEDEMLIAVRKFLIEKKDSLIEELKNSDDFISDEYIDQIEIINTCLENPYTPDSIELERYLYHYTADAVEFPELEKLKAENISLKSKLTLLGNELLEEKNRPPTE